MYRKLFISLTVLLTIIFSFSICFATDGLKDAADSVRNAVGGAENAVEGAVKDMTDASKNATSHMENAANNIGNTIMHNGNNNDTAKDTNNNVRNDGYVATRTSTGSTFMGMGSTAWTWLILGIAAIAIIALVWYYSMQLNGSNHDRNN